MSQLISDYMKVYFQRFWIHIIVEVIVLQENALVLGALSALRDIDIYILFVATYRGVEIVKISTCPGTSKWP